jgi:hypothetical protein
LLSLGPLLPPNAKLSLYRLPVLLLNTPTPSGHGLTIGKTGCFHGDRTMWNILETLLGPPCGFERRVTISVFVIRISALAAYSGPEKEVWGAEARPNVGACALAFELPVIGQKINKGENIFTERYAQSTGLISLSTDEDNWRFQTIVEAHLVHSLVHTAAISRYVAHEHVRVEEGLFPRESTAPPSPGSPSPRICRKILYDRKSDQCPHTCWASTSSAPCLKLIGISIEPPTDTILWGLCSISHVSGLPIHYDCGWTRPKDGRCPMGRLFSEFVVWGAAFNWTEIRLDQRNFGPKLKCP